MSHSSRNPITLSISLLILKANMHFNCQTRINGLFRLHIYLMKATIIASHCVDEGLMHVY
jgi:hypothetical protein